MLEVGRRVDYRVFCGWHALYLVYISSVKALYAHEP